MKKRVLTMLICICVVLSLSVSVDYDKAEAKATNKAMKFLKGSWLSAGHSQSTKVVFTRKYMKTYDLWDDDSDTEVDVTKKGKYMGRQKIASTKKKGKDWYIKVKAKNGYVYYVGHGNSLTCRWKENGEWAYSFSSSLQRYT